MFITEKEFFKRKNRKQMYSTYREHWCSFITSCEVLQDKYAVLERLIKEFRDTEHVYHFLQKVKDDVTCLAQYKMACMYQGATNSDVVLSYGAYKYLLTQQAKINRALGQIDAAILLCDRLKKDELTIRSK